MTKEKALKKQYKKAHSAFTEILLMAKEASGKEAAVYRDSAIQRFEFCTDLAWKLLKEILRKEHKIEAASPKPCIREAFARGLISDEALWLKIIDMRNLTSHTYDEDEVEKIFSKLPAVKKRFDELIKLLGV